MAKKPTKAKDKSHLFQKGGTKPANSGRKKGTQNNMTLAVKTAILRAFDKVGGDDYLVRVAEEDPKTFCTLLGKVLPAELKAEFEHTGEVNIYVNTGMRNRPPVGIHKSKIIEHESTSRTEH